MKILNVMFSKSLGGIEQVFIDYCQAFVMQNFSVVSIVHPKARVKSELTSSYLEVSNFSQYDLFAVNKLRKIIEYEQPRFIITHGNRATSLMRKAAKNVSIIAVCHNYKYKSLIGSDYIIAITNDLKNHLIKAGQPESTIYVVPNMIHIPQDITYTKLKFHKPPIIGAMARFVKKKGLEVFIKALFELKKRNVDFVAKIAGSGEGKARLENLVKRLGLEDKVKFIGWVDDKEEFYHSIDVFCLPSNHEPFGLVLLEAMKYGKAIITTNTEGPSEIVDNSTAVITSIGDYVSLSYAIEKLIKDRVFANKLSKAAFESVQNYSILNISRQLKRVLETVCFNKIIKSN